MIDAPVAESVIIGAAMGAALMGMRPVAEMQFADFITCGFNQLVNNVAKTHYRWGSAVPLVVRCPSGAIGNAGPFHSQNPEAWFCKVPGLKVVAPATTYDAKGLLKSSIQGQQPGALFRAQGPVPLSPDQGRDPRRGLHRAHRRGGDPAGGRRRDDRHLREDGLSQPGRRRNPGRGGRRDGGAGSEVPPCPTTSRPFSHPSGRRTGSWSCTKIR